VPFKIVYARRTPPDKLLQRDDWDDWFDYIIDTLQFVYSLLITEIAPDDGLQASLTLAREGVWYNSYEWHDDTPVVDNLHVLVHLPPDASYDEKRSRVAAAREQFRRWIPDPAIERERESERKRAAELKIRSLSLSPGDRVSHTKFGAGTVVSTSGGGAQAAAMIRFGEKWGLKLLMLRYAPLVKI
jgi:PcrA/UvrD tudor domain